MLWNIIGWSTLVLVLLSASDIISSPWWVVWFGPSMVVGLIVLIIMYRALTDD